MESEESLISASGMEMRRVNTSSGRTKPGFTLRISWKVRIEGNSVRSTARLCDVEPKIVLNILVLASEKCERLLGQTIRNVPVKDVQADEIWSFIGKKEKQIQPVRRSEPGRRLHVRGD